MSDLVICKGQQIEIAVVGDAVQITIGCGSKLGARVVADEMIERVREGELELRIKAKIRD